MRIAPAALLGRRPPSACQRRSFWPPACGPPAFLPPSALPMSATIWTDLFIYHGYVQLWLDGRTYKVTPAFNMELCERFGVKPLVFDGKSDALFHEFNVNDQRHMEYVNDRGIYADAPIEEFLRAFKQTYPKLEQFNRERISRNAEGVDAGFAAAGKA
jgi:hypothetical protein